MTSSTPTTFERIEHRLASAVTAAGPAAAPIVTGRVAGVRGLSLDVLGLTAPVGELVRVRSAAGTPVQAEVVAVSLDPRGRRATCLPLGDTSGLAAGDVVEPTGGALRVQVGTELLGRVLDGLGRPLDGTSLPSTLPWVGIDAPPSDPLSRARVNQPLPTGVRAIDTLTPLARGQRMGVFAGSGVGKSTLLSMLARGSASIGRSGGADGRAHGGITVLALIGERNREVREFLEDDLGEEGLRNAVVIVATSEQPPVVRLRAAFVATRIAEYFRDAGEDVVLMMDSITRLAMAQREIGLSAGEPPTTRGYPPSVFALLPRLLERAGTSSAGSITGIYTVLVDGDDHNEPIADAVRSILDGHLVLERSLAHAGHYPAIDVLQSISRVASQVTTKQERELAGAARDLIAARREVGPLVDIGAYAPGNNLRADRALAAWSDIEAVLRQDTHDLTEPADTWQRLAAAVTGRVSDAAPSDGGEQR